MVSGPGYTIIPCIFDVLRSWPLWNFEQAVVRRSLNALPKLILLRRERMLRRNFNLSRCNRAPTTREFSLKLNSSRMCNWCMRVVIYYRNICLLILILVVEFSTRLFLVKHLRALDMHCEIFEGRLKSTRYSKLEISFFEIKWCFLYCTFRWCWKGINIVSRFKINHRPSLKWSHPRIEFPMIPITSLFLESGTAMQT